MSNDFPMKPAKHELSVEQQNAQIVADALASLEELNDGHKGSHRVTPNGARQVVVRSLSENSEETYSSRRHRALAALSHFAVMVQKAKTVELSVKNTDLLPIAHPLSTKPHNIAPKELDRLRSRWYADDARITDPIVASLLASAFSAPGSSPEYQYAVARLAAMPTSMVPRDALVAAFKMGANKGYWMRQLRDGDGQFAFMGGGLRKLVRGLDGIVRWLTGKTVSTNPDSQTFTMELPNGKLVRSSSGSSQSVKAILPSQQTEDGYSKTPAKYSSADDVTDEADLEVVESPDGWTKNESWKPEQVDREYYGKDTDLGTAFLEADGNYEVIKFEKPNAPAKDQFEVAQQKESEGQDIVAIGNGEKGELDPNLPVYFLRRNEDGAQPFAAVQSWAEVQRLTEQDTEFYEKGEQSGPTRPTPAESEAEIPVGTELKPDQIENLDGDLVEGKPDASKSKVKAYEKKLAKYNEEGGELPLDPRKDYFLGNDGTVVDVETGEVIRDSLGNTKKSEEVSEAAPEEAPTPEAPEAEAAPESAPEGLYNVYRGEYIPEGAIDGQQSDDYTDDPAALAEEYSAADLTTALKEGVESNGFGYLPFSDGDEIVPAEALYNALKEQGEDADTILDSIYKAAKGDKTPDVTPDVKEQLGEDLPEAAEAAPSEDKKFPPVIDGLTDEEKADFENTGDYKKYLETNKSYEDSEVPEGYYNIDPDPFTPIDTDVPEGAPEGFSVSPVDIANDYETNDLINELRRALSPDAVNDGYGVLGMKTPEGEDFVANVPAEAIRDALQLQGVDTQDIIDDEYAQGFKGQDSDAPTPEQVDDALEGENVQEDEAPEATETEEQPAPEATEPSGPSDPDGDGVATGEPDGPAKVTSKAKDLKPGDVTVSDFFTIEDIFSDEESEAAKPGSVWAVGYYPGHATQKTKLWDQNVEIDVYRNIPAPQKGDLPELSKPKPKEYDPEGKIFKDEQLGVFVPKDAEARSKYLDDLDQYNKDLATAKGLWNDAPEPGSVDSWQSEAAAEPFTPANPVGITTVKATEVLPGDIAFKKEWKSDFYEYFIIEGVEEKDGKAVVKGFYPGHQSQEKEWNASTEITVMRGSTDLPTPGNGPALERPKKDDPDFAEKKAAFNEAKKASAEGFTPPIDPEGAPGAAPKPKSKKPSAPVFTGDKLNSLLQQANGDPAELMNLLRQEKLIFLDFETTGQSFATPVPIQFAYSISQNGEILDSGSMWMAPDEPLSDYYTKKSPEEILKDDNGDPISDEWLDKQQSLVAAFGKIADLIDEDTIVVAHNIPFDQKIILNHIDKFGLPYNPAGTIDTLPLARKVINGQNKGDHELGNVAARYGLVPEGNFHDAKSDVEVLEPMMYNLLGEMNITKQGIEALDFTEQLDEAKEAQEAYEAEQEAKKKADTSLLSSKVVADAFDGKDLPELDEIVDSIPEELPSSEEQTSATTPNPDEVSDGDAEIESVLGGVVSNKWVNDDENTTDMGPIPVEEMQPGDFITAPGVTDKWFEVQEVKQDPDDENRMFVVRRLIENGKLYGESKSWIKFKGYQVRRRSSAVEEPVVEESAPQIDTEAKVEKWQGYDIKQDADGVFYADGISGSDVQKLRNGQLTPPQLPFFAPMGGGTANPNLGDGYFFSSEGKRFWGKFGAAGALVRRKNSDNEYEYFLAKRSAGLSQGGGKWGYPGGAHKNKADANSFMPDGSPYDITAVNEFKEEVGGDISPANAVKTGVYYNPVTKDWGYSTFVYEVGPEQLQDLKPTDGENSEVGWFTAEQISKMAADGDLQADFAETADTILGYLTDDADEKEVSTPEPTEVTPTGLGTVYDTSNWKKVGGQKGTAAGGFYVDPDTGQQYYVKSPKGGDMQAVNEVLASAFYEAAGLDVGRAFLGKNKKGDFVIVSPVIDGVDGTLGEIAPNQNILDEIKKGFAVDAWMNNYDVIGLEKDNILVAGGKPFRIDAGGALLFRAQGKSKAEEMDTNVSEQIDSLRDSSQNAQAASVFGDMTDAEIAESVELVKNIDESTIDSLVDAAFASGLADIDSSTIADKLKENLKRRRQELIDQYADEVVEEPSEPVDIAEEQAPEAETPDAEAPSAPKVIAINPFAQSSDQEKIEGIESQLEDAISKGEQVVFKYKGKTVVLNPEEVKTAKSTGNVNLVGTYSNGKYGTFTLMQMEQADGPQAPEGQPESKAGFEDVPEGTTPEEVEKPTEISEDSKQELLKTAEAVANAMFGEADSDKVVEILNNLKNVSGNDPELIDNIIEDITKPAPADVPETQEEKIASDFEQLLSPDEEEAELSPEEISEIDFEAIQKEAAENLTPDLIWAKVKDEYNASVLDNGDIVVHSVQHNNMRFDVVVKRNSDNTFSVYTRITDVETGDTRVRTLTGEWHSFTALESRINTEIGKTNTKPNLVLSKSNKEGISTAFGKQLPPTQEGAYVGADGKTVLEVGMKVVYTKNGKVGVVTSRKPEMKVVDKKTGKVYVYTDVVKVKFDGDTKGNWKVSSYFNPADGEAPPTPDTDEDGGETPGDGGTPPTPETPETPTPAAPEPETETEPAPEPAPEASAEDEVELPTFEGLPISGAATIAEIEIASVNKNSIQHFNAFGAANKSDYKEFVKPYLVKDALGDSNGMNMSPGILVQNADPDGSSDPELTSYGVVKSSDGSNKTVTIYWLDGPLKGEEQKMGGGDVWSREKFITPEQAKQLGTELDPTPFNEAKTQAIAKGKEYIEAQKKAAIAAEQKAAKEKAEKEAKAKKDALKAQFTTNGPGFSINTAELPDMDWSYSPDEEVPSLNAVLQAVQGDDPLTAGNGKTTLVDSDKIEDLEVKLQKVTDEDGNEKIRLSFTLTDWAGNAAVAEMLDANVASSDKINLKKFTRAEDGSLTIKGIWDNSVDGYDKGTTFSGPAGDGGTFELHRAVKTAEAPNFFNHGHSSKYAVSFHNKAEIYLPGNATAEDIQKALEDFGAIGDVRPASPQDIKGVIENKMIWLYGSETDGTKNLVGELKQQQLEFIKDTYGFTADDVEISVDEGSGRINYLIPEEAAQKIADMTGVSYFRHNWTGQSIPTGKEKAEYIYKLFASGGLFATGIRWTNGFNTGGMSSSTDVKATGGNYMFVRPSKNNSNSLSTTLGFSFDAVKMLRRMDWYTNYSDKYGQLESDEENNISKLGSGNSEAMFKKNLTWADLSGIDLNSTTRKQLIKMLTAPDNVVPDAPALVELLKKGLED